VVVIRPQTRSEFPCRDRTVGRARTVARISLSCIVLGVACLAGAIGSLIVSGAAAAQTGPWAVQNLAGDDANFAGMSCFVSSDCWAVGSDGTDTNGAIAVTTDGGTTWGAQTVPSGTGPLAGISCASTADCWAVGSDPTGTNGCRGGHHQRGDHVGCADRAQRDGTARRHLVRVDR